MAALAHAGVGLAAKRLAPSTSVGVLILGAYVLDIVWAAFWLGGLDHFPAPGLAVPAPWSHGLTMAIIWSSAAGAVSHFLVKRWRFSLFFGALVFSHWIVDFITQPMGAAFPGAGFRVKVFPGISPTIEGLGLYDSATILNVIEYGSLAAGAAVYASVAWHQRAARKANPVR